MYYVGAGTGIRVGDILISVDGKSVVNQNINGTKDCVKAALQSIRNGKRKDGQIKLVIFHSDFVAVGHDSLKIFAPAFVPAKKAAPVPGPRMSAPASTPRMSAPVVAPVEEKKKAKKKPIRRKKESGGQLFALSVSLAASMKFLMVSKSLAG